MELCFYTLLVIELLNTSIKYLASFIHFQLYRDNQATNPPQNLES